MTVRLCVRLGETFGGSSERDEICAQQIGTVKMSFLFFFYFSFVDFAPSDICHSAHERIVCARAISHRRISSSSFSNDAVDFGFGFEFGTNAVAQKLNIEMEMEKSTWTIFLYAMRFFVLKLNANRSRDEYVKRHTEQGCRKSATSSGRPSSIGARARARAKPMMAINDKRIHIALILIECR